MQGGWEALRGNLVGWNKGGGGLKSIYGLRGRGKWKHQVKEVKGWGEGHMKASMVERSSETVFQVATDGRYTHTHLHTQMQSHTHTLTYTNAITIIVKFDHLNNKFNYVKIQLRNIWLK